MAWFAQRSRRGSVCRRQKSRGLCGPALLAQSCRGAGSRTYKFAIAMSAAVAVLFVPGAASGKTVIQVRDALVRAQLTPRPLYPSILPNPLSDVSGATFTHGHFFAWKGRNISPNWFSIRYTNRRSPSLTVSFSRGPVSDVSKAINLSQHVQGHPVERTRVDGKVMYRFQTNAWFGYMWKDQGFAYSVFAQNSSQVRWGFVRNFVGSLRPLGRLWDGLTSEGLLISVYRSSAGLDWFVYWNGTCADGSRLGAGWDEDLVGVKRDGTFFDSYSWNWIGNDGTHVRETLTMRGKIPASAGTSAAGFFSAHTANRYDQSDRAWQCDGNVSWQATAI